MLQRLHIENYALISRLDLTLGDGFTVLTGETGAGKSIILGALGLLCGQRADSKALKQGTSHCVVEGEFVVAGFGLDGFMEEHDLDFDGQTLSMRRELSVKSNGTVAATQDMASATATLKSRAFVNDTPVPLTVLKALGDRLIDIHSQHQNLLVGQQSFQLDVLDRLAHAEGRVAHYREAYADWTAARQRLSEARARIGKAKEEEDYLRFQVEQLESAHLRAGEQSELETEANVLSHAEEIKQQLALTQNLLCGEAEGCPNVLDSLRQATDALREVADKMPDVAGLAERLQSDYIDLQDAADELAGKVEHVEVDPQRAEEVEERLRLLYDLERKHHVDTDVQLVEILETLESQLADIDHADENVSMLEKECEKLHSLVEERAAALTEVRQKAAKTVEQRMTEMLHPLGMPHARFAVEMKQTEPSATGRDAVSFLFSGNKNGVLNDVASVASGGEIARVMLSLKALVADASNMPTLILDEIDTGLSGAVAEKMGHLMKQMAAGGRQVISITHLPQIAACGTDHLRVSKDEQGNAAESHIERLTAEERIDAIARLLSGERLTDAARDNARALLQNG